MIFAVQFLFYHLVIVICKVSTYPVGIPNVKKIHSEMNGDVKGTFAKLLERIVIANEKRLDAVSRLWKLQDLNNLKSGLRSVLEDNEQMKDARRNFLIYVINLNRKPSLDFVFDNNYSKGDSDTTISNAAMSQGGILRSVWKGCQKRAAKVCKNACRAASKSVCEEYECRSKQKKELKKECKRKCKDYFLN